MSLGLNLEYREHRDIGNSTGGYIAIAVAQCTVAVRVRALRALNLEHLDYVDHHATLGEELLI